MSAAGLEPFDPMKPPDPDSGERPADRGALQPGTWVGRYQVEALLGRGGMGAVYRVRDSVLERSVALKAIRFGETGDPAVLGRFRREAMALAQVNHPNVCQVHDWVESGNGAFIAMELIEGKTLTESAPALDATSKLGVLRDIACALQAAHAKGIVHRDLKPFNIMVTGERRVKVLDFGLARFLGAGESSAGGPLDLASGQPWADLGDSSRTSLRAPSDGDQATQMLSQEPDPGRGSQQENFTVAGSFLGSPGYASPEQIARLVVGPPSDIFSLGIVAWELLLGEHPFPGKGAERLAGILAGRRRSLNGSKLPPRIKTLLRRMLARDPSARPTAQELAATLNRHLAPFPLAGWIVLAAACLCLVSGLTYFRYGRSIVADLIKDRPPRLAVLPIQNGTGDPALAPLVEVGMTELLATALRDSSSLTVVDGDSVQRAYSTLRLDPGRPLEPAQQAHLLQALGAPLVLQGSLDRDPKGALRLSYALGTRAGQVRYRGQTALAAGEAFTAYALVNPAASELLRKLDPLAGGPVHGSAPPAEAFAAYARGKALLFKGDFKGSEALLGEAALKAPAFSQAVTAYASCLRRLGRDQAAVVTNWAIMAARATGDRWSEGRALGVKAYLASDHGDQAEAETLRRTTLALSEGLHDLDGATVATIHLGLIEAERGRDAQAQQYYEKALELAHQLADQTYVALAENNLANLALKRGDLQGARSRYQEVLNTQRAMGNSFGEGLALNNLGVVALTAGGLAEAELQLSRALAIRTAAGDLAGRATSLRNLGILALMRGDLDRAQSSYQLALQVAQSSGIRAIEAECRFCLGDLLRLRLHLQPAQQEYQRALDMLAPGVTPQVRAGALAGLAECQARLAPARGDQARQRLEALDPAFRGSPYSLRAWAWVHFLAGRRAKALEALDQAKADPGHSAPEIQRELGQLRVQFLAQGGPMPAHP